MFVVRFKCQNKPSTRVLQLSPEAVGGLQGTWRSLNHPARYCQDGKTTTTTGAAATPPPTWIILCAGAKARLLGEVEAADERGVIETPAELFRVSATKLIATRRR